MMSPLHRHACLRELILQFLERARWAIVIRKQIAIQSLSTAWEALMSYRLGECDLEYPYRYSLVATTDSKSGKGGGCRPVQPERSFW